MLVVDASVAVQMALHGGRPPALADQVLIAPPLLWSETTSALHELAFRGDVTLDIAAGAIAGLIDLHLERRDHLHLYAEASRIARRLGWAKTYDAEYVALAMLTASSLLTRDARLRRGASRLVMTVGPAEL